MGVKLQLDYPEAISEFERILRKFNMKKKIYKLLFSGRGLEFEQFRNFEDSDDASGIDWPASLRADKLLIKQYVEEKDINFYFVVEVSKSMLFGSGNKLKAEYAADIILSLTDLVFTSQDKSGLVMFNDKVVNYVSPKNYKKQFYSMEELLSNMEGYGGGTDFKGVIDFLLQIIKGKNNMVVFISDFLHMPSNIGADFDLLTKKSEVIAIAVRDLLDLELPKTSNLLVLRDPIYDEALVVDTSIVKNSYEEITRKQTQAVREVFKNTEIDYLELRADSPFVIPIIQFLQQRVGGINHGHLF
ncbi:MAG: DUF58 domain-containing protein [Nanoarchaeota archaeon]